MYEAFWLDRWKRNQIGFHDAEINQNLREFWHVLDAAPSATVFVPLCGKSKDMLWLRERGHFVIGVELSRLAVAAFFSENGLTPRWTRQGRFDVCEDDGLQIKCGNFFDLTRDDLSNVTAVYDRAALVALPPEMQKAYVAHTTHLLSAGTRTLLLTHEFADSEIEGPPFSISEVDAQRLYGRGADIRLLSRQPAVWTREDDVVASPSSVHSCVFIVNGSSRRGGSIELR